MHSDSSKTDNKRNPRASMKGNQSPLARGREKLIATLTWLYCWHATAGPIVRELLGTTQTNYLSELEKKGYVRSLNAPTLLCGRAYILTKDGVNAAAAALGRELQYSVHPSSVAHATLKHDLCVQRACLNVHKRGLTVAPARFLSADNDGKIPDAIVTGPAGERIAVEIELSGKWSRELEQTLASHLRALANGQWEKVVYVSNSQAILERYQNRLKLEIPEWYKAQNPHTHERWIRGEPRAVSDAERECFMWQHAPQLLKGFEVL